MALALWWFWLARPASRRQPFRSPFRAELSRGHRWFLRIATGAGVAAVIAMEAGWTVTEVGRQPWIVYGVMRTTEAVNPASGLRYGLYIVLAVYGVLAFLTVLVLRRFRHVPATEPVRELVG